MSNHEFSRRTALDDKLAILEAVRRRGNVRLSAFVANPREDPDLRSIVEELRTADLVSASPVDDDLVLTSLPRLRDHERTKLHRLLYT